MVHETPRFLLAAGRHEEFESASHSIFGEPVPTSRAAAPNRSRARASFWGGFHQLVANRRWAQYLVGASATWFVMDFAYYGNTVSTPLVLAALTPHEGLLNHTLTELGIFVLAAAV